MEEQSTLEMEPNLRNRDDSSNTTAQLNISTINVPESHKSQNELPLHIPVCFTNTTEHLEVLAKDDTEGPLHTIEEHLALTNFYDKYMNLNLQQDTIIEPNKQNSVDPNTIIHDSYTNNSMQLPTLSGNIAGGSTYKSTYFNLKEISNVPDDIEQVALTRNIPANISDDYMRTIQNDFHTRTLVENSAHSILDQKGSSYLHNNLNIASQQGPETLSEHNPTTRMDYNVQHDGTAWEENLYTNILEFMENFTDRPLDPSYNTAPQDIFAIFSGSIHTTQSEITSINSNQNVFQLDSRIIPRTSTTTVLKENAYSRISNTQYDPLTRKILGDSTHILEKETASPNFHFNGRQQQGTVTTNNSEFILETCLGEELWREILEINSDIPLQHKFSTRNGPEGSKHSLKKQNEFTNDIFDGMKNDAIYMPTTSTIPSNICKMNNTMQNDPLAKNVRRRSNHSSKEKMALTNDIFDEMKKDGIYVPPTSTIPSNIRNKNSAMQNVPGRSNHRLEKDIASEHDIFEDMKKDGMFIPTTSTIPSNIRNSNTTVQHDPMTKTVQEYYTYKSAKRKALRTTFSGSSANNTYQQINESVDNNIKKLLSDTPEPHKLTSIFPKYSRNRTVECNDSTSNSNESSLNTTSEHNASKTIRCGNATINQNMAVRPKTTISDEYAYTENSEDENACSLVAFELNNLDVSDKSCQSSYSETNKIKERDKEYKSCQQNTNGAKSKKKRKVFRPLQLLPNNFQVNDPEHDQYFRVTDDESMSDMYDQNPIRNPDRSNNPKYNRNPNHNYNKNYYQKEDHNYNTNHNYKNSENYNQTDDKNTKQQKKKNNEENKQNNPHKPRKKE